MTGKTFPVQKRDSVDSDWTDTEETATAAAVRKYNKYHGWEKARVVDPAEQLRTNMAELAHPTLTPVTEKVDA